MGKVFLLEIFTLLIRTFALTESTYIVASCELVIRLSTHRRVVALDSTDLTDATVVVITAADSRSGILALLRRSGFNLPVCLLSETTVKRLEGTQAVIAGKDQEWLELEVATRDYEARLLPPFFNTPTQYVRMDNNTFACPGHQYGAFFKKHPVGRQFYDLLGENVSRADMRNADVRLGDLLVHEGSAKYVQKLTVKVFSADKTYSVLNGTSAANKVVINTLLTRGGLVLFDHNNHKSDHHEALIQAEATPVYPEAVRNSLGLIGGIDERCFDEYYLRDLIREAAFEKANVSRPLRLAVIQPGTYDGTVYNACQVVGKIGHLCDYILFDSAQVGHEQLILMMADCSPLLLELTPDDPGTFVTQSVHKQQVGFSQTPQVHKKDNHLCSRACFCPHKRLNNASMLYASISSFYPLSTALDANAKIHESESGRRLQAECAVLGTETRKAIIASCKMIQSFTPLVVAGHPWRDHPTEAITRERRLFSFESDVRWYGFEGHAGDQYSVDPYKLLLIIPGIDAEGGEYSEFDIPTTILAYYLRENGIVPEKCDLNSTLLLLTSAKSIEKMAQLVAMLRQLEQHTESDTPPADVLSTIYNKYPVRYRDHTLRELYQKIHDLYVSFDAKSLQKEMFCKRSPPRVVMNPQDANREFICGNVELVYLSEAEGRIAAEGVLPCPLGVLCMVPGETWGGVVLRYFPTLEEGVNMLPGFSPESQGVHSETDLDGIKRLCGYVLEG